MVKTLKICGIKASLLTEQGAPYWIIDLDGLDSFQASVSAKTNQMELMPMSPIPTPLGALNLGLLSVILYILDACHKRQWGVAMDLINQLNETVEITLL